MFYNHPHFIFCCSNFFWSRIKSWSNSNNNFCIPPMTRLTILNLKGISRDKEAGIMAGCSKWQILLKLDTFNKIVYNVRRKSSYNTMSRHGSNDFIYWSKGLGHDLSKVTKFKAWTSIRNWGCGCFYSYYA